jgi:MoaA/NifB/PqqE/SkfB family radical SAM enzyme
LGFLLEETKLENQRFSILLYQTLKCQLKCSYCGFYPVLVKRDVGRDLKWYEWLVALNPYRPYTLELCGGEPLLYPDFRNFIAHIPDQCNWSITSNTLLDVSNIAPRHLSFWNASFHYRDEDKFLENCKTLTRSGMKPSITLVARQDKMDEVEHYARLFTDKKFSVVLQREVNPGVSWEGTDAWKKLQELSKIKNVTRIMDDESVPADFNFNSYDYCDSGQKYFCASSDGTVYRCFSDLLRNESIGNIFEFRPFTEDKRCGKMCRPCGFELTLSRWNEKSMIVTPEEARMFA